MPQLQNSNSQTSVVTINGFEIDAVLTEEHEFDTEVTKYPVEVGSDIADNVRVKPRVVTLTDGIVSDTPIGALATRRAQSTSRPSEDARSLLEQIRQAREPVVITTDLQTYKNMVMESLTISRMAKDGGALKFKAKFVEVILVTNNRTFKKVAIPSTQGRQGLGHKATREEEWNGTNSQQAQAQQAKLKQQAAAAPPQALANQTTAWKQAESQGVR